ncbi:DNA topoisomerase II large subunit [Maribacter phage Molly_5]|uniref:DNA topoisomerase (ATP-hydrolyzing) n=1 Tax=Maribacter phage Molly_1 TaxID=2745685 RepID=A0A8E4XY68_9CAUD|nr:DNA topoisomerase II large subunit [Maribacter phage Molly_1]QQO97587.1 DNA topoisomerase II large subunit [Maribacter phage Molly_1]QQO97987.1 DNA topoisomerase II large subunit [Maribacter phage Molly_3]QQO98187.1 DNA topoisomerase II large subunit [Maribacter phage Molly_4]QQO98387.1 DNA topoisomerase II large subunit [Maribacter phage Molly_5]
MSEYNADSIKALTPLDAIRLRPSMYIGDVDHQGFHHLAIEILNNSVDEYLGGHCSKIIVKVDPTEITIVDNGRGIPWKMNKEEGKSSLEVVTTMVHAGGKFDRDSYEVSGGLNGVGLTICNALGEKYEVYSKRDKATYSIKLSKGTITQNVKKESGEVELLNSLSTGTLSILKPDSNIFEYKLGFDSEFIRTIIKDLSYICPGLEFQFYKSYSTPEPEVFLTENGLQDLIQEYYDKVGISEDDLLAKPLQINENNVEIFLQFNTNNHNSFSFVNGISTYEGGSHVQSIEACWYSTLKEILRKSDIRKDQTTFGLVFAIHLKIAEPKFRGQSKSRLSQSEAYTQVYEVIDAHLKKYILQNRGIEAAVLKYYQETKKLTEDIKAQKDEIKEIYKKTVEQNQLPMSLVRSNRNIKAPEREIYIVEGQSAAGTVIEARDPYYQEVLPLKGKFTNSIRADKLSTLKSEEVHNIAMSIGCGILDSFDITKVRADKIIIASDSDQDGQHITSLLLTFLINFMPEVVKTGKVYVAYIPLFTLAQKEKFAYGNSEKECIANFIQRHGVQPKGYNIYRAKGLGEFNSEELEELLMNPESRTIEQLTLSNTCIEKINDIMSGDTTADLLTNIE